MIKCVFWSSLQLLSKTFLILRIKEHMEVTRTVVNGNHLQCGKYEFEHVKELSYLDSQLNQTNSTNCEIQARIISGNQCCYSCGALMKSRALSRSSKPKIYTTLIRPAVTYGCETWTLTSRNEQQLRTFEQESIWPSTK